MFLVTRRKRFSTCSRQPQDVEIQFALRSLSVSAGVQRFRWRSLCYAQIGGLAVATFITLLLVLYAIFVLERQ